MSSSNKHQINRNDIIGWGCHEIADFGTLWMAWSQRGLTHLCYHALRLSAEDVEKEADVPEPFVNALCDYFAGRPVVFNKLALDPQGTPFQMRVWQALRNIPHGQVRSYAGIANDIGSPRAMRAVGAANGKNPISILIPCHRVIAADFGLGGYTGGLDRKKHLLALEGARLVDNKVQPGQLTLF